MNPRDVPIPALMRHLPLDKRGYPIIPIILNDKDGPKFALNDEATRQRVLSEDRCGICGNKLHRARWLVGGPGSAFLEHGAYLDPPMHTECLHYAMQVCPYLAAPRWSGPIGKKQAANFKKDEGDRLILVGEAADPIFPDRPEIFVAVQYIGKAVLHTSEQNMRVIVPPKPFRQIEYWVGGKQLTTSEGEAMVVAVIADMVTKFEQETGVPTNSNFTK